MDIGLLGLDAISMGECFQDYSRIQNLEAESQNTELGQI